MRPWVDDTTFDVSGTIERIGTMNLVGRTEGFKRFYLNVKTSVEGDKMVLPVAAIDRDTGDHSRVRPLRLTVNHKPAVRSIRPGRS